MNKLNQLSEQLRQLSRMYVVMQKYRNKFDNLNRSKIIYLDDSKKWKNTFDQNSVPIKQSEKEIKKELLRLVKQHPWGNYLLSIKGVGEGIAGGIIGELCGAIYSSIPKDEKKESNVLPKPKLIGYNRIFESTSNLWAYAGYSVVDGHAQKREKGKQSSYNKYLKLICYKFIENQIKQGDKYREIYDQRKVYEKTNHPELTKMHIENRTKRYVIKKFLSDIKHNLIDNYEVSTLN